MKTQIVLIPVDNESDGRKIAERIESQKYSSISEILEEFPEEERESIIIHELTDFMDLCNNQELNLESVWVSYVNLI